VGTSETPVSLAAAPAFSALAPPIYATPAVLWGTAAGQLVGMYPVALGCSALVIPVFARAAELQEIAVELLVVTYPAAPALLVIVSASAFEVENISSGLDHYSSVRSGYRDSVLVTVLAVTINKNSTNTCGAGATKLQTGQSILKCSIDFGPVCCFQIKALQRSSSRQRGYAAKNIKRMRWRQGIKKRENG